MMKKHNTVETKQVRSLKAGEFFRLTKYAKTTYVMGVLRGWKYEREYDASSKTFATTRFDDFSDGRELSGDREVVVNFTF